MGRKATIRKVRALQVALAVNTRELVIRQRRKGTPQTWPQYFPPDPPFGFVITDREFAFKALPPIPPP